MRLSSEIASFSYRVVKSVIEIRLPRMPTGEQPGGLHASESVPLALSFDSANAEIRVLQAGIHSHVADKNIEHEAPVQELLHVERNANAAHLPVIGTTDFRGNVGTCIHVRVQVEGNGAFDNLIWPTFDTFIWPTLRPLFCSFFRG